MIQDPDIFKQQEIELRRLTVQLDDLKRQYDNYFVGLEKRQPGLLRARLDRTVRDTKLHTTLSTVLRFKFRQFLARYRTYSVNWDRICREIEEGTYRRGSTTAAERLAQQRSEAALRRARGVDDPLMSGDEELDSDNKRLRNAAKEAEAFLAALLGSDEPNVAKAQSQPTSPNVSEQVAPKATSGALTADTDVVGPPKRVETTGHSTRPSLGARPRRTTDAAALPPPIRTTDSGLPPAIRITDAEGLPPVIRQTSPPGGADSAGKRRPRAPDSREGVEALYASYLHARRSQGDDVSNVSLTKFSRSIERQKEKARARLQTDDVVLRLKVAGGKVKLVASKAATEKEQQ